MKLIQSILLFGAMVESVAFARNQKIATFDLTNKLNVVTYEDHKVPLVTLVLVSKAGAMTETPDIGGLTHLWEHMFFKGNKVIPDQEAFHQKIRQLGIVYNGDTSAEMVRYYFTLPSKHLDEGLAFMANAISSPLLDQVEMEKERKVVLDEYDRNASRPNFDLYNITRMVSFGTMENLRNPLGRRKIIENATKEQLLRIQREVFVPDNCALIVSGDLDPRTIKKSIDNQFAKWKTPEHWIPVKVPEMPPLNATQALDITMQRPLVQNPQLAFVYNGPLAKKQFKDSVIADVLSGLLSHKSGVFFQKYIQSGYAYQAGLSYHTQSKNGQITMMASAPADKIEALKKDLNLEISEWIKPNYFTASQLKDTKNKMYIMQQHEYDKPSEFGKSLAFWWAILGIEYIDKYFAELNKLNLNDIRKFIETYLHNQTKLTTLLISPEDGKRANIKDNSKPLMEKYLKNY